MKILIAGVCGFVGSSLAQAFCEENPAWTISGIDNLSRPGSEQNRARLKKLGVNFVHADVRSAVDIETLAAADWVIDAAANPSVLAGVNGAGSSRQIVEHNLGGTINLLEYCKRHRAGFILLSTSRVYAITPLATLELDVREHAFHPKAGATPVPGLGAAGIAEAFSTRPPVSLYGATKLASEYLALEYGEAFDFPVWINRCGNLAGAGQFGRSDQGIFAFWIHSYLRRAPLRYVGFGGEGHQVRDCLHPRDLFSLLALQISATEQRAPRISNVLEEIALHAEQNPDWLERSRD
jgi:CDP-paratose 2-epimerase